MNQILSKHTGQTEQRVADDVDRDRFMSPVEAQEYGLIDHVVESQTQVVGGGGLKETDRK